MASPATTTPWYSLILSGKPEEGAWIDATATTLLYYISPLLFVLLYFVLPSPYGKLMTPQWQSVLGPAVPAPVAWFLFELPNLLWVGATVWNHRYHRAAAVSPSGMTTNDNRTCSYILLGFFIVHYIRRALVYPWRMSSRARPVPFGVILNAVAYTSINGYLQCQSLLAFDHFPPQWSTTHPAFVGGLTMAILGMLVNAQSDAALRLLRSESRNVKTGYRIPRGYWLFDYVSCPHYLGEVLEWVGFTIACPSVVTASFAAFTAANLIPRAVQQHAWYQNEFGETYPAQRKAWLPFLW